ncbi:glycosyltransferase [Salinimicrobium gaetbulicola]|uniref:Glycosyltransferase n=1 Tax=Salinimicrobium gaetbulicola TaxID=999702 RepID=A0ABW3IIJ2_9FLAO
MKVLYIVGQFPSLSETFIINQINAIIKNEFGVNIYSYKKAVFFGHDSIKENKLLEKTYYHQKCPESRKKRLKDFFFWLIENITKVNFSPLLQILRRKDLYRKSSFFMLFYEARWFLIHNRYRKFDVIHAHFGHNGERIARLFDIGLFKNTKLIVSFHGFDLIPKVAANINLHYPNILKTYSALTVNTKYLESLLNGSNLDLKNMHVLPVGLDTSFFKKEETNNKNGKFRILFCGRLIPLKAPDLAIEILGKVIKDGYSNCELLIVGDGKMKNQISNLILDKGLKGKVICMGPLVQSEVRAAMDRSSVLIMPGIPDPETGREETQGLVIQEAQSMNLPVIVSDVGGMKYGLIENETGYVIPAGNIKKFAEKVEYLIDHPEVRECMGEAGRLYVENNFDSRILADDLIKLYKSSI